MTRNESREIMMQILYEMDAAKSMDIENAAKLANARLSGNHRQRGEKLLTDIVVHLDELDDLINQNSRTWKTSRMPKVDVAIMRLALGEIKFADDIPVAVSINEALNLAKKFSMEKSSGFIHGILGSIVNTDEK